MTLAQKLSGEADLCGAVIEAAISDLRLKDMPPEAKTASLGQRIREQRSAISFFMSHRSNFHWMVASLGIDAEVVVEALLDDMETTELQIQRMMERIRELSPRSSAGRTA